LLIYVPVTIGLADNSDFFRTISAFKLTPVHGITYWSAESLYRISDPASVVQYFKRIFFPVQDSPMDYYSTQFIFTKVALFLNALTGKLLHREPGLFHLFFQTVQYMLLYALALTLFLKEKWLDKPYANWVLKAVFALILLDCGYLVYFNSFFGEATTLIFLVMSFVFLLYLLEKDKNTYWVYLRPLKKSV
jgi:hypothetical protein